MKYKLFILLLDLWESSDAFLHREMGHDLPNNVAVYSLLKRLRYLTNQDMGNALYQVCKVNISDLVEFTENTLSRNE